ncbi:hypothetical protein KP509_11G039900 [Ceratopteris richardii]|uniref:Uncharacterized protein n=1 Tax=Ceratopteris richardii TaxID=49495 RepID=A0A8T2TRP8_CERRI|nr:hypothetical protein KP509_11G039900 [Ceratopteris richardii]KAH7425098.1 hypothetical protein KP509_11G039900 [Ceratopteris richardii]KAH7425100.1 hypothetical protein KP509_11G039900 [Ceratopteris richardii]
MEDEASSSDHLVVEVLTRVPVANWASAACVRKSWAVFFGGEMLWEAALAKQWPNARNDRRWPGAIQQGSQKRRYIALFVSKSLFSFEDKYGDIDELAGHAYLFLKEQLQVPTPMSYGFLQRTIIDQLLACGEESDIAHKLAAHVWVAVISNLEENEHTFRLLMQMVEEWEAFLPYPYSKSHAVQWRLFERLFTDFRDCLSATDYYSALTRAKDKFEFLPATWLGY